MHGSISHKEFVMSLKEDLVKLAYNNPELRDDLLPLLKEERTKEAAGGVEIDQYLNQIAADYADLVQDKMEMDFGHLLEDVQTKQESNMSYGNRHIIHGVLKGEDHREEGDPKILKASVAIATAPTHKEFLDYTTGTVKTDHRYYQLNNNKISLGKVGDDDGAMVMVNFDRSSDIREFEQKLKRRDVI